MKPKTKLERIRNAFIESIKKSTTAKLPQFETITLKRLITLAKKFQVSLVTCPSCGNNLLTPDEREKEVIASSIELEQLPFFIFDAYQELERAGNHY